MEDERWIGGHEMGEMRDGLRAGVGVGVVVKMLIPPLLGGD